MVQKSGCKRSNDGSRSQSRLKQQKMIWEVKKNLVKDRIKSLEKTIGEFMNKDTNTNTPKIPQPKLEPPSYRRRFSDVKTSPVKHAKVVQAKTSPPKLKPSRDLPSCNDIDTSAMERAKEVQANFSPKFPSFLKIMLKSHISGGFWLGLPRKFCVEHLPEFDARMVLVDENGKESYVKYLVGKNGLSGGWRGFSIDHKLLDGDVLVFQLIEKCKFKIYVVRERILTEVEAATGLQYLASQGEPINTDSASETFDASEDMSTVNANEGMPTVNASEDKDTTPSLGNFTIHVDGLILDSEIPVHLRKKYHELCRSQSSILHDNLIKGLNTKLAAGMISETISIADAIRAIKSISAIEHLESWDRTLKAFEDVGMGVGFMRTRIHVLLGLYRDSQAIIGSKKTERAVVEDKMRELRMKLSMAEVAITCLDSQIKALEEKNETLEYVFKEVAKTPW